MSEKSPKRTEDQKSHEIYDSINEALTSGAFSIIDANHSAIDFPEDLMRIINQSVESLSQGRSVEVVDSGLEITSQEAADYLGMSRPTLVQLLVDGKIPYTQLGEGKHRRIRISDLVGYQRKTQREREDALTRMVQISQEMMADPDYLEPSMPEIIRIIKDIRKENAAKKGATRNP
jgi:excisionase family DNA binding protein